MSTNEYVQFVDSIEDIIANEKTHEMKKYVQHRTTNTYEHCLYVSFISYVISKKFKKNYKEAARGAMLHDFFLYDWHITKQEKMHAFAHGKIALDNSEKYFELTKLEREIILKHMWPVTPRFPRYFCTYVVTVADKYCAIMEFFGLNKRFLKKAENLGIL